MNKLYSTIAMLLVAGACLANGFFGFVDNGVQPFVGFGGGGLYVPIVVDATPVPTSDLILEYLMGANGSESSITLDSSPNAYTGTVVNATWQAYTNGIANNYDFDASAERINAGDVADVGTDDFTLSAWIKLNNSITSDDNAIISKRQMDLGTGWPGYTLFRANAGETIRLALEDSDSIAVIDSSSSPLGGIWYQVHVVCDRDGNGDIYLNGVYDNGGSIATESGSADNAIPLTVGNYYGIGGTYTSELEGEMFGARIYSRVLTASEILATNLYQRAELGIASKASRDLSLDSTKVLDVTMNGDAANAQDGSTNNAALTVTAVTAGDGGRTNGWGDFNGSTSIITTPDAAVLDFGTDDFSVMGWVNFSGISQGLCAKRNTGGALDGWTMFAATSGGIPSFLIDGGATVVQATGSAINDSVWHHMAGVRSGDNTYLYIDGIRVGSNTGVDALNVDSTAFLKLGGTRSGGLLTGSEDEIKLYDSAISSNNISNLFLAEYPRFGYIAGIETNSWWDNVVLLSTWNTPDSGKTADISGNGNHGTDTAITKDVATGDATFNGSTSESDFGNGSDFDITGTNITIACWFKTSTTLSGIWTIKDNATTQRSYSLSYGGSGGNYAPRFYIFDSGSVFHDCHATAYYNVYDDGVWHSAVGRYDGVNLSIWVDNVKLKEVEALNKNIKSSTADFRVGKKSDGVSGSEFTGSLDNVYVLNTAWSDEDIAAFHSRGHAPQ